MSNEPQIIEQAEPLAPPSEASETPNKSSLDDIIDLDAPQESEPSEPEAQEDSKRPASEEPKSEPEPEEPGSDEEPEESDDELLANLSKEPEKPKRPSGSAKLKAQLAEAQAEIERLRKVAPRADDAAEFNAAVEREIGAPPKESDFEDYLAFQNASIAYQAAKMMVSRELKKASEQAKSAIQDHSNRLVQTFQERAAEVKAIMPDFDAVVQSATVSPAHPDVAMAILESEKGPQIAYYLSKRPEKVHELNAMPLRRQLAEIGRLEARLTPAPSKQTKAPPPIKTLPTASAKTQKTLSDFTDAEIERMPMGQFEKLYKAQQQLKG